MEFKKLNKYIIPLITVLVIYLPTLAYIPIYVYLVLIPIVGYLHFNAIKSWLKSDNKFTSNIIVIASILVFAFINRLIHFRIESPELLYSDVFLLPIILLAALVFSNKKYYTLFIVFVGIELLFGVTQFVSGESTFLRNLPNYVEFPNYNLIYYCRVFGLSTNSSIFALKIFAAIFLVRSLKLNFKWLMLLNIFLYFGIIITFNRAAILGCAIFELLYFLTLLIKKKYTLKQVVVLGVVALVLLVNFKEVKRQLLRQSEGLQSSISHSNHGESFSEKEAIAMLENNLSNDKDVAKILDSFKTTDDSAVRKALMDEYLKHTKTKLIYSGRKSIWTRYGNFIKENLLLGNGSKRLIDPYAYHAHSIYLHLFSMHGIIIALLFIYFIVKNITLKNAPVIIALLVIGIFQSVIFWGISALDIVFYSILLKPFNIFED